MLYRLILLNIIFFIGCSGAKSKIDQSAVNTTKEVKTKTSSNELNQHIPNNLNTEKHAKPSQTPYNPSRLTVSYDPNNPILSHDLPAALEEVSGLSLSNKKGGYMVINDEEGIIYQLDQSFEVAKKIDFGKAGDYEGIEIVGNTAYIIASNGHFYQAQLDGKKEINDMRTRFNSANDIEGLAYHLPSKTLLFACKARPGDDFKNELTTKAIFKFDIEKQTLAEDPFLKITDQMMESALAKYLYNKRVSKDQHDKMLHRVKEFSPSGIAYNKSNKLNYILSAAGRTLIAVNDDNKIRELYLLDEKTHRQPEGICFDDANKMYITNEGKSSSAKLHQFEMLN